MRYLLHMTGMSQWRGSSGDIEPDSLSTEGFAHASPDEATLLAVANAFYRATTEQQVALLVDPERLGVELRWEAPSPAPPPGVAPEVEFPHIYGPIRREAVLDLHYLRRDPAGVFTAVERRGGTAEVLDLLPHPEGGWYRSTWRTGVDLRPAGYPGERATATGIHFLLRPDECSRWHRVRSDEVWVFNRGGPLELTLGGAGGHPVAEDSWTLGPNIEAGQVLQVLVPAGTWQAARPLAEEETLVSCFVSPGFDFGDFEVEP